MKAGDTLVAYNASVWQALVMQQVDEAIPVQTSSVESIFDQIVTKLENALLKAKVK